MKNSNDKLVSLIMLCVTAMLLIFLGSMINFNVTIYFIPIFAIEYLLSSSNATANNTAK